MAKLKRCPRHPDGCGLNHRKTERTPGLSGNPAKRPRLTTLRGSLARYVLHQYDNGARLLVDRRTGTERWIRGARRSAYPDPIEFASVDRQHRMEG